MEMKKSPVNLILKTQNIEEEGLILIRLKSASLEFCDLFSAERAYI